LNGINSIRPDVNIARYDSAAASKKRVVPLAALETATEADKRKQFKTELNNEFSSRRYHSESNSQLLLSDSKYYRANLLNEIVNKMSGIENHTRPGHFVEYFA
jgi:hypothetical protein